MSSLPVAQRPPPSHYQNLGHLHQHHQHHHAFGQASPSYSGPMSSSDAYYQPRSSGRDASPPFPTKPSSFGLNPLMQRAGPPAETYSIPSLPNPYEQSYQFPSQQQAMPSAFANGNSPPRRLSGAPAALPLGAQSNFHAMPEQRGRTRPFTGPHVPVDGDVMSPLPLPPRIPGGVHTRESSGNRSGSSRERPGSSAGSAGSSSRPVTPGSASGSRSSLFGRQSTPGDEAGSFGKKKKGFMGKLHKKTASGISAGPKPEMQAFFVGPKGRAEDYNLTPLLFGQPVPELWQPEGNLLVYLYERAPKASFRLDSSIIASSRGLQRLVTGGSRRTQVSSPTRQLRHMSLSGTYSSSSPQHARSSSAGSADAPWSPSADDEPQELELRLPLMIDPNDPAPEEITDLITARNMFATLVGQLIVGNMMLPSFYHIFISVAGMMKRFDFGNFDGSTMGEAGEAAFLGYVADLRLDDVRKSREKTIEALILGEKMRCWPLYNEAYVHGVGKWKDLVEKKDPKLSAVSYRTRIAMEKSAMDLDSRISSVRMHLDDFQFHGLFAGFANSRATKQAVDIQAWETSWKAMRKHVLSFYKKAYGNWPPKAKSKKNEFEESGLNRLLLQEVYRDFTDLYDMLVDRAALTERTLDATHADKLSDNVAMDHLRKLLSEFDRSMTPVRPPIPFDIPLLPALSGAVRGYEEMDQASQDRERSKKQKGDNLTTILMNSYNKDGLKQTSPFIEAYMAWERNIGSGRSVNELDNIRVGAWIFIYVVLQMLPLLVVDAPGLRHTRGVEYFLCEVPKSSPPWMPEQAGGNVYYRIANTGGVVSMPADLVEHGVEGIFQRSHCWLAASRWTGQNAESLLPHTMPALAGLQLPDGGSGSLSPAFGAGGDYPSSAHLSESRSASGRTASEYSDLAAPPMIMTDGLLAAAAAGASPRGSRNSFMPGLEALPMPPSLGGADGRIGGNARRVSTFDPTKNFDDILGSIATQQQQQPSQQPHDAPKLKKGKK